LWNTWIVHDLWNLRIKKAKGKGNNQTSEKGEKQKREENPGGKRTQEPEEPC
jgi:hypothetical protein